MFCHSCSAQNLDTSLNCTQCGASLLGSSVSDPQTFAARAKATDNRYYGHTWSVVFLLAYFFVAAMLVPELRENKYVFWGGSLVAVGLGKLFGRAVARAQNGGY